MFNKSLNTYFFNEKLKGGQKIIYKDTIQIFNNQQFIINFSNLQIECSDSSITNSQIFKVKVEWGDGGEDLISKSIISSSSSIGVYQQRNWKIAKHTFNSDKRNVYLTDDVKSLPKIIISFYNTFNDIVKVCIPYKLIYKSIYDLETNFSMMSGNISNKNRSSFVIKNDKESSMFIVSVRDWEKIYGDQEITYVSDSKVSVDYSDEFVNEEEIIWSWDVNPSAALNCEVTINDDKNVICIKGYVTNEYIQLHSWTPKCFLLGENEEALNIVQIDKDNGLFYVFNYDASEKKYKDIKNGMYKIYVQLEGMNGLKGSSEVVYLDKGKNASDKLEVPFGSDLCTKSDKKLIIRYQLPSQAFPSHIRYAKMYLTTEEYDESNDGLCKYQQFDGSDKLIFQYDLPLTDEYKVTGKDYYQIEIPFNAIPNGQYNFVFQVKQLSKGNQDEAQQNIYKDNKVYTPSPVRIEYTNIGTITRPVIDIKGQTIEIEWKVQNPSEIDIINYRVSQTTNDYKQVKKYITDRNVSWDSFEYNKVGDDYIFNETIDFNSIPDGYYKFNVSHVLPMSQYVGQRQVHNYTDCQLTYPCPRMKMKDITPFYKKNSFGNFDIHFNFKVESPTQNVKDVQISFYDKNLKVGKSYLCNNNEINISGSQITTNTSGVLAYNETDATYKRKQKVPTYKSTITMDDKMTIVSNFDKSDLVSKQIVYVNNDNQMRVTGDSLQRDTSYTLKKNYKWVDEENNQQYYTIGDTYDYSINLNGEKTKNKKMVFQGEKYTSVDNDSLTVYRYRPILLEEDFDTWKTSKTKVELNSVEKYLVDKQIFFEKSYDKTNDTINLLVKSKRPLYLKNPYEIQDAFFTIKKNNNSQEKTINAKNDTRVLFQRLEPNDYTLTIDFHSTNTDSVGLTQYKKEVPLYVDASDTIDFSHEKVLLGTNKFGRIRWNLNYGGLVQPKLHWYAITKTTTTTNGTYNGQIVDTKQQTITTPVTTYPIAAKSGMYETDLFDDSTKTVIDNSTVTTIKKQITIYYYFTIDGDYINWGEDIQDDNKQIPREQVQLALSK